MKQKPTVVLHITSPPAKVVLNNLFIYHRLFSLQVTENENDNNIDMEKKKRDNSGNNNRQLHY